MNLRPTVEGCRGAWQAGLRRLIARSEFILGEEGAAFEREFAGFLGARYSIAVSSGTAALELSLRDARVRGEVLTTALTTPFTAHAITAAGAAPRFADIDPETLQMDPADAAQRLSKKTACLLPVHLYGQVGPVDRWAALARERGLTLVQDACQAHGALFRDNALTSYSDYVCYSFYPTKNLGALGDGGAIATNRSGVHRRLRLWRDGGRNGHHVSIAPGMNSRLDEVQACYLRAALKHLKRWNRERARLAMLYDDALADCPGVTLVRRDENSVHHLYVIRAHRRERLRRALASQGIGTGVHYPVPLHLHPAFENARQKKGSLPHAERACREIVSLPLWPGLKDSEVFRVAEAIRKVYA